MGLLDFVVHKGTLFTNNEIELLDKHFIDISKFTDNISEGWSKGDSRIENSLYHIHLGDWVSWYLSEMNEVDAIEIDVINFLKSSLAKL